MHTSESFQGTTENKLSALNNSYMRCFRTLHSLVLLLDIVVFRELIVYNW